MSNTNSTEILMMTMAGLASKASVTTLTADYPSGWLTLAYINGRASSQTPASQGFLAKGPIDPDNPTSEIVMILALGLDWELFLKEYEYSKSSQMFLPTSISGTSVSGAKISRVFTNAYLNIRDVIWAEITKNKSLKLLICGMGLGGPLAQLASLDLRPSNTHKGPNNEFPPYKVQPPCYVFSVPNISNADMINYFNESVIDPDGNIACNTYWVGSEITTVDFFPTQPDDVDFGPLGNEIMIQDATIPPIDVPWLERGNTFYIEQLGGVPAPGPAVKSSFNNVPSGFDLPTAYAFAQIVAQLYGKAQHPFSSVSNTSTFSIKEIIKSEGSPFAFVCQSIDETNVLVALRGTYTWDEADKITANSKQVASIIFPGSRVHKGAGDLYNISTTEEGGDIIFKTALRDAIKKLTGASKLYITGHSIGGALANLAAADFTVNPIEGITLTQVYTFGAISVGNSSFAKKFNDVVGDKCYQVRRIYDKISIALGSKYAKLNNGVVVNGVLSIEENTYHSLEGYMKLLDPSVKGAQLFSASLDTNKLKKRKRKRFRKTKHIAFCDQ